MLSDFLKLLLDFIEVLWPLRRLDAWEGGVYLVNGKVAVPPRFLTGFKLLTSPVVGPGVWGRIPWFIDVVGCSTAYGIANTGRIDIEARDGRILSLSASAKCRVIDVQKSVVGVHEHERSMQEILAGAISEYMSEIELDRLAPDKRGALNTYLTKHVKKEAAEFGIEVEWVRFTTFVTKVKIIRLLNEPSVMMGTW